MATRSSGKSPSDFDPAVQRKAARIEKRLRKFHALGCQANQLAVSTSEFGAKHDIDEHRMRRIRKFVASTAPRTSIDFVRFVARMACRCNGGMSHIFSYLRTRRMQAGSRAGRTRGMDSADAQPVSSPARSITKCSRPVHTAASERCGWDVPAKTGVGNVGPALRGRDGSHPRRARAEAS